MVYLWGQITVSLQTLSWQIMVTLREKSWMTSSVTWWRDWARRYVNMLEIHELLGDNSSVWMADAQLYAWVERLHKTSDGIMMKSPRLPSAAISALCCLWAVPLPWILMEMENKQTISSSLSCLLLSINGPRTSTGLCFGLLWHRCDRNKCILPSVLLNYGIEPKPSTGRINEFMA